MKRLRVHVMDKPFKGWRIACFVLIAALLLGRLYLWTVSQSTNTQRATEHFDTAVQYDVTQLRTGFKMYANIVYSGQALFVTDRTVTRQKWSTFVNTQNIIDRYPGVYALSYAKVIPRDQETNYVRILNSSRRASETEAFTIFPASQGAERAVLTYIAPDSSDQQAIGYDMYSSDVRMRMLLAARDSGTPRASAPLNLISHQPKIIPSMLLAVPIYSSGVPLTTVENRRGAVDGYIVLALRIQRLLDPVFKDGLQNRNIAVSISTDGQTVYHNGTKLSDQTLRKTVVMDVAGQSWHVQFSAPATYGLSKVAIHEPPILLWSTVPFMIVLFLVFVLGVKMGVLKQYHQSLQQKK